MQRILSFLLSILTFLFAFLSCGGGYEATPGEIFSSPFYGESETAERLTALFNGVYALFGGSDTEHTLVYRFGNEATYFDWMAKKLVWTGDEAYLTELKNKMIAYPQTDSGYFWSWETSTYWPTGRGNMHYDGLFNFITAAYEIICWENAADFLFAKDTDTCGNDTALDASAGKTVYEKCALAMEYALQTLGGASGIITITENSVYLADGVRRFDINDRGENVWNNTGLEGSASSNYWDNFCFGHIDAYETMLFYNAVNAMAGMERMLGNTEKAKEYEKLSAKIHTAFDTMFWDEAKGRYIGCIDINGIRHDLGFTFLNVQALAAGLGDRAKADKIFSWINGERIIAGETSTGADITDYTAFINHIAGENAVKESYRFIPRSATVSVESQKTANGYWWESLEGGIRAEKNGNAAYGIHLENGGYIFWTVYYELAAYARFGYTDKLLSRVNDLKNVYDFNGFDSDLGGWAEGLTGEFPENGIVSRVYISDILGFTAANGALHLRPALPDGCEKLGTQRLFYAGNLFTAEITKNKATLSGSEEIKAFELILDGISSASAEFLDQNGSTLAAFHASGRENVNIPVNAAGAYTVIISY